MRTQRGNERRRPRPRSDLTSYWLAYAIVLVVGAALMIFAFI